MQWAMLAAGSGEAAAPLVGEVPHPAVCSSDTRFSSLQSKNEPRWQLFGPEREVESVLGSELQSRNGVGR